MNDNTVLTLVNGTEVQLPRPNMKMWRKVAEYDEIDKTEWSLNKLMAEHAAMLVEMYGLENADEIDPADVLPMYVRAASYVINVASEKLRNLPNVEEGIDQK
jgi:hypothetical protein